MGKEHIAIPETEELKEFGESNDLDEIEHDNPGENSCLLLCEICGKDFDGPRTLKIHKKVHFSENLEIMDDLSLEILIKPKSLLKNLLENFLHLKFWMKFSISIFSL